MLLIVASDLMVIASLEQVARQGGINVRSLSPTAVAGAEFPTPPALVLIDLSAICDATDLIASLRARLGADTTLAAFAPHVHTAKLKAAHQAGCDRVFTRGQLQTEALRLIEAVNGGAAPGQESGD